MWCYRKGLVSSTNIYSKIYLRDWILCIINNAKGNRLSKVNKTYFLNLKKKCFIDDINKTQDENN